VILTEVPAVEVDHGTPRARPIGRTTVVEPTGGAGRR
jgi:hypothetical protein